MSRQKVAVAGFGLAGLAVVATISIGHTAAAATPNPAPNPTTILIDTMESELHRAMDSLGNTATDATQQPKPYFLSYAVSDSDSIAMSAQFGAITSSNESRRRSADVQVRLGAPGEDNTHGDHRNSALTTVPLPLTDDGAALARSLWFATNRGYGKALDGYLKVKTEQQVRAKEEDSSADFSSEKPATDLLPSAPALVVDRNAWQDRLRELSAIFKQYPDVFFNNVALEASTETDYFVSSEG
ncbi:MAG: peptidase U62, partial [Edaphobacter sp.]